MADKNKRLTTHIRSSKEFKLLLEQIKIDRIRAGKNNSLLSDRRLTLAISRIPNIKQILMENEIKEDY